MNWFGFGFNGFGQIIHRQNAEDDNAKVFTPVGLGSVCGCDNGEKYETLSSENKIDRSEQKIRVVASWSRRGAVHINGEGHVSLSGFQKNSACGEECWTESKGCKDAVLAESFLTLGFADRVECWRLEKNGKALAWSGVQDASSSTGRTLSLPLVPGGYIASKPPVFWPLSPQLCAVSLVLGPEHTVLLTTSGTVYTWGNGSHGQLGHGSLTSEAEPKVVEALWGVSMKSVAAGSWHSACISAGGDLYVWGWNEKGQIGLPSKGLKEENQKGQSTGKSQPMGNEREDQGSNDVFISIQAFPALVDISEESEVIKVSCGSRHTAAITYSGDLYTWGWGHYGQLGHGSENSSDEPKLVEYFSSGGMKVEDVVCGLWNTFVSAVPRECSSLCPTKTAQSLMEDPLHRNCNSEK